MSNTYPDASRYCALFTTPEQSSGVSCVQVQNVGRYHVIESRELIDHVIL